jgi:SAM-dependent methyltransferase
VNEPSVATEPVDFDARAHPTRMNIGCGWDKRDGYLNVDFQDFHEPDLVADVRDLSMLPVDFYDEIVAQDVLEHLERDEVDPALQGWTKLLKVGGRLVLRVPDIIGLARVMSDLDTVAEQRKLIQNLYGTQAYTGDYHHAGFTELTLRHSLHEAGMDVVELVRKDEWMFDCVAVRVDKPGRFKPGPLPFLQLCDHNQPGGVQRVVPANASQVDRVMASIADRVPEGPRRKARSLWRPIRRQLAKRGVV